MTRIGKSNSMSPHYKSKVSVPTTLQTTKQWQHAIKIEESKQYQAQLLPQEKRVTETINAFVVRLRTRLLDIVKSKGGTEGSIIRHCFLDWDADRSGELDFDEFRSAMRSIGMQMTPEECEEIVEFYDLEGDGEMKYEPLVKEVQRGIKHWMEHPSTAEVKTSRRDPTASPVNKELAKRMNIDLGSSSPSARSSTSARSAASARSALLDSAKKSARSNNGSARSGMESSRSSSSQSEIKRLEEQLREERKARTQAEEQLKSMKMVRIAEGKSSEGEYNEAFNEFKEAKQRGGV